MTRSIFFGFIILIVLACEDNEPEANASFFGTWQLVEVLADPGDGSGEFRPIDSDETITFLSSGIVQTSGNFCPLSSGSFLTETSYSITDLLIDINCANLEYQMPFDFDGTNVILRPPCIEPCGAKYRKIKDAD